MANLKLDTASQQGAKKDDSAAIRAQVKQLQRDLVTLGVQPASPMATTDAGTRAVLRFQRHAARAYQMPQPDAGGGDLFKGLVTGTCDAATAQEVPKWIAKRWVLRLNRFQLSAITVPDGDTARPVALSSKVAVTASTIAGAPSISRKRWAEARVFK